MGPRTGSAAGSPVVPPQPWSCETHTGLWAPCCFRNTAQDTGAVWASNCGSGRTSDLWSCKNWPITFRKLLKIHFQSQQLWKACTAAAGMDGMAGLRSSGFHCLRVLLVSYFILLPFSLVYNITTQLRHLRRRENMTTQTILSRCSCIIWTKHVCVWFLLQWEVAKQRGLGVWQLFSFSCLFSMGS